MSTTNDDLPFIVLHGPTNSGKGTQGGKLAGKFGLLHYSTGDALRALPPDDPDHLEAQSCLNAGQLVSSRLAIRLVTETVERQLARGQGVLFDGAIRQVEQAVALDGLLERHGQRLDTFVSLKLSAQECLRRALMRRREDDTVNLVEQRLRDYAANLPALQEYYLSRLKPGVPVLLELDINGLGIDETFNLLHQHLWQYT